MSEREKKKWLVIYFDEQDNIIDPVWDVESKIKPTRWASNAYPDTTFKIKQVQAFSDAGYSESFLRGEA